MSAISIGVQIVHQQTQRTALLEKFPKMVWFLKFNATAVEIFICLKIIKNCWVSITLAIFIIFKWTQRKQPLPHVRRHLSLADRLSLRGLEPGLRPHKGELPDPKHVRLKVWGQRSNRPPYLRRPLFLWNEILPRSRPLPIGWPPAANSKLGIWLLLKGLAWSSSHDRRHPHLRGA